MVFLAQLILFSRGKKKKRKHRILKTYHLIVNRWRSAFRSDELFADIKYVLNLFCEPYFQLFQVNIYTSINRKS